MLFPKHRRESDILSYPEPFQLGGARWLSGRVSDSGARGWGVRNLPPQCCVLEQDTLLPESTG